MRVCVVGSVNMDLVVRCARLPKAGETLLGSAYRTYPGGKGANQAVAARRLGAEVSLIASVGDDAHGKRVREALEAEGVDLGGVVVREGEPSGLAMITVVEGGAEGGTGTIVVAPGANARLGEEDVARQAEMIRGCDVLLMQLEVPLGSVRRAAMIAREAGRTVMLNAAPARALPADLLKMVDVLVVNRAEGASLMGVESSADPARFGARLGELGPAAVVMTLGSAGSLLVHRGRVKRVGTPSVKCVDATGAGDAFCGALAAVWGGSGDSVRASEARSAEELKRAEAAVAFASGAGAAATMRAGALPSLPTRAQVEAVLGIAGTGVGSAAGVG